MTARDEGHWDPAGDEQPQRLVLRLYITRGATNSLRAMANLTAILEEHFAGHYSLEVVDLLLDPQRAFADNILVTPTLVKVAPLPCTVLAGNLSRTAVVLQALLGAGGA